MAAPSVFVSSTFYDLRYIRGNVSFFITTLGYNPILSERGAVYYDPSRHVQDAAIAEVPNCQLFVLIIGGRYGAEHHGTGSSVTNEEYREAVTHKIPVFALVEQGVHADFHVWQANRDEPHADSIAYPNTDDVRVFAFIDEVQAAAQNNAIVPFRDWSDIESYLRQQWSGMMFAFLNAAGNENRVADTLAVLTDMNARIEVLSTQILKSVGTEAAQATARMYALMLDSRAVDDLRSLNIIPRPSEIIEHPTLQELTVASGKEWEPGENYDFDISSSGEIAAYRFELDNEDYRQLRARLLELLRSAGMGLDDLKQQESEI